MRFITMNTTVGQFLAFAFYISFLLLPKNGLAQYCPGNIMLNPSLEDAGNTTFNTTFEGTPAFFLNSGLAVERIPNWFFLPGATFNESQKLGLFYLNKSTSNGDPYDGSKYLWLRGTNLCAYIGTVLTDECSSYNLCFQTAAYSPSPQMQQAADFAVEFWFTNSAGGFIQQKYTFQAPASQGWNNLNWNQYCKNISFPAGYDRVEILVSGEEQQDGITLDAFCITASGCGACHGVSIAGPDVCAGETVPLTSTISGASNLVTYQWEESTNGSTWNPIAGATTANYNYPNLNTNRWFRLQTIDLQKGTANPTGPSQGFGIFVEQNGFFSGGESEGPVAIGKDLHINGTFNLATTQTGNFRTPGDNLPTALIVGEKVKYNSGTGINIQLPAQVKVGNLAGSMIWTQQNGSTVNTRLTNGAYENLPRIQTLSQQTPSSVGPQSPIDFTSAFSKLKQNSAAIASCGSTITIQPTGAGTGTISLQSYQNNMLDLTTAQMNSYTQLSFTNLPVNSSPLIINVDAAGTLNWTPPILTGLSSAQGAYIIWNFHNTTTLNINGNAAIYGTILAPNAIIVKNSSATIAGQIIGKSYQQSAGTIIPKSYDGQLRYFSCTAPCQVLSSPLQITVTAPISASITANSNQICTSGTVNFSAQTTNSNPISYQWQSSLNGTSWTEINNATQAILTTHPLNSDMYFRLKITQNAPTGCNIAYSNTQLVTVKSDPIVQISTNGNNACIGGSIYLSASTSGGSGTCTLQWQQSTNAGASWTDIAGANQPSYTTPPLVQNMKFRAIYVCSDSGCCE